jgi:hypothetical protein
MRRQKRTLTSAHHVHAVAYDAIDRLAEMTVVSFFKAMPARPDLVFASF